MDCVLELLYIDLVLRVWRPTLCTTFLFVAQIPRPGSISAECFQHSFLSMEYSDSCQAQVREQSRTSEKNRLEICQTGKCLEICLSNTYLFIYWFSVAPTNLDLWKLHKKSLRKETTIVISWIYLGGGSWILMNFSDMTIRDVLSGPTVARWHCWLWPAGSFCHRLWCTGHLRKRRHLFMNLFTYVYRVDLYMFIDNMNTCLTTCKWAWISVLTVSLQNRFERHPISHA